MTKNQLRPAASAFLMMLTISLITTGLSFFVAPVCEELGFGRGSFTLYYSLMVATGAVAISVLGGYMNRKGVKGISLISAVWVFACLFGFSLTSNLFVFYALGAIMGFFGSSCIYLCANLIVQKSYSSEGASAVLGVVMAGSGIGGVLGSNVVPRVLDAMGWRMGYRILGFLWMILILLSILVLGKEKQMDFAAGAGHHADGSSKKETMRSGKFILAVTLMCIITVCTCISQQLPSLLDGMGFDAGQVGVMISVMTGASAIGMVMEGMLCSRFGVRRIFPGFLVGYAVGFLMLMSRGLVYPALVLLAFGGGTFSTLMPVLVRQAFGGRDYAALWSVILTFSSIASFIATPVWGMIYDMFGSYAPALLTMPVLLVLGLGCMKKIFK